MSIERPVDPSAISRRRFLASTARLSAGLAAAAYGASSLAFPRRALAGPIPDAVVELTCAAGTANVRAGALTNVWKYTGSLTSGPANTLATLNDSYLGPVFRLWNGQRLRVGLNNNLTEDTITHWHGIDAPAEDDGHPMYAVGAGGRYEYDFEIHNRAGTYWYHPHPDMRTAVQVQNGLAGVMIVHDDKEALLNLPSGEQDLVMVIQDRTFNASNQFVYQVRGMAGSYGDTILVNGKPNYTVSAATRPYRVRILNGSNSRIYKLGFSDGSPLYIIGTDGGLLTRPMKMPFAILGPGERLELWVDLRRYSVGQQLKLVNQPYTLTGPSIPLPQGSAFDIATFSIDRNETDTRQLPNYLAESYLDNVGFDEAYAVNALNPRVINITNSGGHWRFNGLSFTMMGYEPWEIVSKVGPEIWEFVNTASNAQAHPMHLHGPQFRVLSRSLAPGWEASYETVKDGFVDRGLKDTVMVWPGETVRILSHPPTYSGLFMYHCHNLEHEDMGMMRNFYVAP